MNKSFLIIMLSAASVSGFAQAKKTTAATKPAAAKTTPATSAASASTLKNATDSVSYAVGVRIAQSLKSQGFDKINPVFLEKAIGDVLHNNKIAIADEAINQCIGSYQQKVSAEKMAVVKKEGQAFLANNAKRPGVITLPDGLQYEVIRAGTSDVKPSLTSNVKVHYHGTLINGTVFDSSVDKGQPVVYPVNRFIAGWQEALTMMTVGSKWKLYVPSDLAYGDNGPPNIGPGATLIFEMELLGIEP